MASVWWVSFRFLALYTLLLGVCGNPPVQPVIGRAVASVAAEILQLSLGRPIESSLGAGTMVLTVPEYDDAEAAETEIGTLEHIRNLALFLAVVLAAAKVRDRRLVMVAVIGSLGLIVLDGAIVAAEAWLNLSDSVGFNRAYEVLAVLSVYHATGAAGMFAAPAFVGALAVFALNQPRAT
ncbi:MAG: hypothetical protein HYR72_07150 [Deltaproteobacteria bacterium]|nr:hypothetical protein [Deltaproteobacteria bacterium]MBI3387269.1 hypothetical protein [Deltaproteobacteria bacterium]